MLNVRGQQTIYVESNSGSFGGIVIDNNILTGTGIGVDNIDQVIEIGDGRIIILWLLFQTILFRTIMAEPLCVDSLMT